MAGYVVHIEPKSADAEEAARVLSRVLGAEGRAEITAADAATLSGLPLDRCEPALLLLSSRYPSRLRVTESGAMLFTFDSFRPLRSDGRLAVAYRKIRAWLRAKRDEAIALSAAVVGPPVVALVALNMGALANFAVEQPLWAAIPIGLVVFPVLFATFTLAFLSIVILQVFPLIGIALVGIGVALPIIPFLDGMGGLSLTGRVLVALALGVAGLLALLPGWMLTRLGYETFRDIVHEPKHETTKAIWRGVGGFLLGPPRARDDGLSDERRLVALIRERSGLLVEADLMALFGWTRAEAGVELARILADYGGDVEVTDDGAILYRFDPLMQTAGRAAAHADTRPAWEVETGPPQFFGSPRWANVWALAAMGIAITGLLVAPGLVLLPDRAAYAQLADRAGDATVFEGLGAWPYLVVGSILALRLPLWLARRAGHERRARLLSLLRVAVESPNRARVPRPNASDLASLGGELVAEGPDARDRWLVRFPDLALAKRAAARAVRPSLAAANAGPIAFDTAPDAPSDPHRSAAVPVAAPPAKKKRKARKRRGGS